MLQCNCTERMMHVKTYTVKQIAELLNTNPETVRRWIRDGKLKAEQASRKDGNTVTADELARFVKENPKYSSVLATLGGGVLGGTVATSVATSLLSVGAISIPGFGIPIAASLLGGSVAGFFMKKNSSGDKISDHEVIECFENSIKEHEKTIEEKRAKIKDLEFEIFKEEKSIEELKYVIEHYTSSNAK